MSTIQICGTVSGDYAPVVTAWGLLEPGAMQKFLLSNATTGKWHVEPQEKVYMELCFCFDRNGIST